MSFEEAVELLSFHCGSNQNTDDPRWDRGWLQTLRPYKGSLDHDAWASVIACVDAISEYLRTSHQLDRSVINSLWGICFFSRYWALDPEGMLRSNHLISQADQDTLSQWVQNLEFRIAMLLDGNPAPPT